MFGASGIGNHMKAMNGYAEKHGERKAAILCWIQPIALFAFFGLLYLIMNRESIF